MYPWKAMPLQASCINIPRWGRNKRNCSITLEHTLISSIYIYIYYQQFMEYWIETICKVTDLANDLYSWKHLNMKLNKKLLQLNQFRHHLCINPISASKLDLYIGCCFLFSRDTRLPRHWQDPVLDPRVSHGPAQLALTNPFTFRKPWFWLRIDRCFFTF